MKKDTNEHRMVDAIVTTIKKALAPVQAKTADLEQRLAALEAKPSVKFLGTWERGKTYAPGDAVVRDGGLWICKAETPGEPKQDFVGWQLAVKRGAAS